MILLSSGVTVTLCHSCFMSWRYGYSLSTLQFTILLALLFTIWQGYEYQTTWLNLEQ